MLVRKRGGEDDASVYAMKVLFKASVVRLNQVEHTRTERNVLEYLKHPFIVRMRYAFQTREKLFFVLDYCPGGEVFFHLGRAGRFSEHRARFYAAESRWCEYSCDGSLTFNCVLCTLHPQISLSICDFTHYSRVGNRVSARFRHRLPRSEA
jgi:hypothetical protein